VEIIFENDKVRVTYLDNHYLLYTYKESGVRLVSCEPQPNLQTAKEAFKQEGLGRANGAE